MRGGRQWRGAAPNSHLDLSIINFLAALTCIHARRQSITGQTQTVQCMQLWAISSMHVFGVCEEAGAPGGHSKGRANVEGEVGT